MDVENDENLEEGDRSRSPALSLPRFKLVETVVTAIGRNPSSSASYGSAMAGGEEDEQGMQYEYVTHLERNSDGSTVAAALSSREIKLYTRSDSTLPFKGNLDGHSGAITQLAFAHSDPWALFSSSQDGTVKGWDTRTMKEAICFGQSREEVWSMALGYDGHLCATGKGLTVEFYDLRKAGARLGAYSESHTDAVTQVTFNPHNQSFLASGSEDGLICYFDTRVSTEEDAVDSVLNAECPVRSLGFFGPRGEGLYCCTTTESLSLWDPQGAQRIADLGDVRTLARGDSNSSEMSDCGGASAGTRSWGVPVDCVVGCEYEPDLDRLWLVAGGFEGGGCLASVTRDGIALEAVLGGGHREQIRAFDWTGRSMVTGGEDAKLCLWSAPDSGEDGVHEQETGDARSLGSDMVAGRLNPRGGLSESARVVRSKAGDHRAKRTFQPYDAKGRRR